METRSLPGKFLSGDVMHKASETRKRPFGHVAISYLTAKGSFIRYEPDPAQAEYDEKLAN